MTLRALPLLLVLAACAQALDTPPGIGDSSLPEADEAVRAVETTGRTGLRVLGLTQGRTRACSGSYEPPTRASPVRTTELTCTEGVTGTATVGPDPLGGRSVRWSLETGESGRARL
jgi:hypothetical protein